MSRTTVRAAQFGRMRSLAADVGGVEAERVHQVQEALLLVDRRIDHRR
jgi:hypothetical protein